MKASLLDWLIAAIAFVVICIVFSLMEAGDSSNLPDQPAASASQAASLRVDGLASPAPLSPAPSASAPAPAQTEMQRLGQEAERMTGMTARL